MFKVYNTQLRSKFLNKIRNIEVKEAKVKITFKMEQSFTKSSLMEYPIISHEIETLLKFNQC